MGIRTKILLGFFILAVMLLLAGAWSIHELSTMGQSVQRLLDDNYRSINAARQMTEALERQDSGLLLLISGNRQRGDEVQKAAALAFEAAFKNAEANVTIPGEKAYVVEINNAYRVFKDLWEYALAELAREEGLDWYFGHAHPRFLEVKTAVEKLMALNDREMYRIANQLKDRARRAVMPGIVAILSALVFSALFSYFVNYYLVSPILRIRRGVEAFVANRTDFNVNIETRDELYDLARSVKELMSRPGCREAS